MTTEFPNKGTLWYETEKKHERGPDFRGTIKVERDYLLSLIEESSGGVVEIKMDGWRGKVNTRNGERHVINLSVNTWKPDGSTRVRQDAPDEDLPF